MPRPSCYVDHCDRPNHAQGLCQIHYTRARTKWVREGRWESVTVDADAFKHRICAFLDAGYNFSMLERLTGIDRNTFARAIEKDRKKVLVGNAETLEQLPLTPLYELWRSDIGMDYSVPSYLATRRVRALMAMGWTPIKIGATAGLPRQTIQRFAHYVTEKDGVMRSTLLKIDRAYNELWDKQPTHHRHCETTKYRHWPMPLEWDDDKIDLPGGEWVPERRARNRMAEQEVA